jgi:hypothetical protein
VAFAPGVLLAEVLLLILGAFVSLCWIGLGIAFTR